MNDTLLDISKKIEPQKAGVLVAVDRVAKKAGIQFFIVGAAARDFILHYVYEIRPTRATLDVDIGVRVSSWAQYKSGGDFEIIIARILGRDIKKLAGQEICPIVTGILDRETDREGPLRFIQNMQERAAQGDSAIPRDIEMLNAVAKGAAD
jgi:predicted nucleotidyltransferase